MSPQEWKELEPFHVTGYEDQLMVRDIEWGQAMQSPSIWWWHADYTPAQRTMSVRKTQRTCLSGPDLYFIFHAEVTPTMTWFQLMHLWDISCYFTYQQNVQAAWGNFKKNASKPWGLHRPPRKASPSPDVVPLAASDDAPKPQPSPCSASEAWPWCLSRDITKVSKGDCLLLPTPSILS